MDTNTNTPRKPTDSLGVASAAPCSVCNGLGYYETWKHDYGSEVRKHKCPCIIPNYVQPDCPLLGIKGGDPMTLLGIAPDLEDEDNIPQNP